MDGLARQDDGGTEHRFRCFCASVEPRLRRALVAAYGADLGREATAEALAWGWENFERLEAMSNPAGYLWRVGQTAVRRELRHRSRTRPGVVPDGVTTPRAEPDLAPAIATLSERQRVAVLLVHGHGYSLSEAAEQMGCRIRTLRNHLDRGMRKLRYQIGGAGDG